MRSRSVWSMPAVSLLGLGLGLAAGAAAGLLSAPMRGVDMRRSLRSRADGALDRGKSLIDEGRRAFSRQALPAPTSPSYASSRTPGSASLSATLGEIAQFHAGDDLSSLGARS